MAEDLPYAICPRCGRASHHDRDIREGWCGFCEDWTGGIRELDLRMGALQADHYDRQGHPITFGRWAWLNERENFAQYRRVAETVIEDFRVSTVWLGLDHNFGFQDGPPIIFETMIFQDTDAERVPVGDLMWRWTTEADAIEGHEQAVTLITVAGAAVRQAFTDIDQETQ